MYNTRLLGRFAPIFYFHSELTLIVTLKNKEKKFLGFYKKDFKYFYKTKKKLLNTNFFNFYHSWTFPGVTQDPPQKIWARSVQPYWRFLETNKQTNITTDKPKLYIDNKLDKHKMITIITAITTIITILIVNIYLYTCIFFFKVYVISG